MPYFQSDDGLRIYFEETGQGHPIVFVHEFGGDYRSWEPQVRHFCRRFRCITFNARGYPPSEVPERVEQYSQQRAVGDLSNLLDHLGLKKAHMVGLSMGGFTTVHYGIQRPDSCRSLVIAATGFGAEKHLAHDFRQNMEEIARKFEKRGSKEFAETYALSASRVQFLNKDPRGWREFADLLAEHSDVGAANTMRGVQARRSSLYDLEDKLRQMSIPTLIISGDEDDHCLQPAIYLKRTISASGLLVLPKTGHTINLEEPKEFNRALDSFFAMVEADRWLPRDPRADPEQFMKTE